MPDEPIKVGSITKSADLMGERASEVSNVSKTINEMQRDVNQRITEVEDQFGDADQIGEVQEATVNILRKMSMAMGSFADGVTSVTSGIAGATKDAIGQYGKAISEDISINKQSIVATALSRTTPLFGYFAAKFMETDVFQKAKEKMKASMGQAFSGIGKTISGFFKGKSGAETEKVPKMQSGGYVKKGGMVEVHAGEIVAPIEKVLDKVDATVSATQDLAKITKRAQLNTLAKMGTFVRSNEEMQKVGLFKGFLRAARQVQTQYEEPANIRQLRATLAIQQALGATIGTWPQIWQKMLIEHPTFRNMMFFFRGMGNMFVKYPARLAFAVFKSRGGYSSQLAQSKNPFEQLNLNLGLLYSEGMWRLDNIAKFTKATAIATRDLSTFTTGKKYPPLTGVPTSIWNIASMTWSFLKFATGAKWIAPVIEKFTRKHFPILGSPFYAKWEGIPELIENIHLKLSPSKREFESIYGERAGLGAEGLLAEGGPGPPSPLLMWLTSMADGAAAMPVKMIEYDGEAEILEEERTSSLVSGIDSLYSGWQKQHKLQKSQSKDQQETAKELKEHNRREKRRTLSGLFGGIAGLFTGGIGGIFKWLGIGSAALAAGGVIGTIIDDFFFKDARKAFLTAMDEISAEAVENMRKKTLEAVQIMVDRSQSPEKRAAQAGLAERERTIAPTSVSAERLYAIAGGKARRFITAGGTWIEKVQDYQSDYMRDNYDKYAIYSSAELTRTREEFIKKGMGPKLGIIDVWNKGQVKKYAARREEAYLKYLNQRGKRLRAGEYGTKAEAQVAADVARMEAEKAKKGSVVDRVTGAVSDAYSLGVDKAKEGLAGAKLTAEAIKESTVENAKALAEQGEKAMAAGQSHVTQIVSSVSNSAQTVGSRGYEKMQDAYTNLSRTVITGKIMDDPIMFD